MNFPTQKRTATRISCKLGPRKLPLQIQQESISELGDTQTGASEDDFSNTRLHCHPGFYAGRAREHYVSKSKRKTARIGKYSSWRQRGLFSNPREQVFHSKTPHQGRGEDFFGAKCVTHGKLCHGKNAKEKIFLSTCRPGCDL